MKFVREAYSIELVAEMMPLLKEHHAELADQFYGTIDPDFSIYQACENNGSLRIFTAREDNVLFGYQVFFVMNHHHYRGMTQATQDILFLDREARKGLSGFKFIAWCTQYLKEEGIQVVHQRISAKHDFGHLFERLGFELEDLTYSRRF